MYFDAISYGTPSLSALIEMVGDDRIMFGTDNPFFPPDVSGEIDVTTLEWPSTKKVLTTIEELKWQESKNKILTTNADRILKLS